MKTGLDQKAMIEQFAYAAAQGAQQMRRSVHDATLQALQGRELSIANIRGVLANVTSAAGMGATNSGVATVEGMLDQAVAGIDDALLKAVEANRIALQQLVDQGVSLRETHLKKALADMDKMEDAMLVAVQKAAGGAGSAMAAQWAQVMEKFTPGGTRTGAQATRSVEDLMGQMSSAMRDSRATGLKAAQTLAESYAALASGVLIGISEAMQKSGAPSRPKRK